MIIFTTAYTEYAVESYEYQAVDYLLKPIEFERFIKAANKALDVFRKNLNSPVNNYTAEQKNDASGTVFIKSGTDIYNLNVDDILYIESAGNYVEFVTARQKVMSLMNMAGVLDLLKDFRFIRVHRSYIVSVKNIDVIESETIRTGKFKIPIGEKFKENIKTILEVTNGKA
jgi:DNA-binding LytR/AlgR family response regulator